MTDTIQVRLTDQRCELGDAYARKHMTTPPKIAVLSCEGMCLRGEVARRAANLIAHELEPARTVRVCHGGLLETSGGMRELVARADRVLMLDGCFLACGTRLLRGALLRAGPRWCVRIECSSSIALSSASTNCQSRKSKRMPRGRERVVAEYVIAEKLNVEAGSSIESTACSGGDQNA